MLLRRCSLAAMGHSRVSRMPWSKPLGSAQAATAAPRDPSGSHGDAHSELVADAVLQEGLLRVPRHLKMGPRLRPRQGQRRRRPLDLRGAAAGEPAVLLSLPCFEPAVLRACCALIQVAMTCCGRRFRRCRHRDRQSSTRPPPPPSSAALAVLRMPLHCCEALLPP